MFQAHAQDRSDDSAPASDSIQDRRRNIINWYALVVLAQLVVYLIFFILPGFYVNVFRFPVPKILLLIVTFWQVVIIGIYWWIAPTSKWVKAALNVISFFHSCASVSLSRPLSRQHRYHERDGSNLLC